MTIAWSEYQKFVMPEVPKCPAPICVDAIRAAATHFLKETRFHHVATLAQAVTTAGTRSVAVTIPSGSKAWAPLWVNFHPASSTTVMTELVAKSPQDLDALVPNWRASLDTVGSPAYYTMRGEALIALAPWPDANGSVDYDFSFIPTPASTGYIDDLFNLFYEQVALGAKAKLFLQAGQPWGNAAIGAAYWKEFELMCAAAAVREDRGRANSIITTRTEYP